MKFRAIAAAFGMLGCDGAFALQPDPSDPSEWGKPPEASDDRFTNPAKPLYAGPNGWWNTGEVRAVVENAGRSAYQYRANFVPIQGAFEAVKDLQTLHMDFGAEGTPAPGTYQITAKGNPTNKSVSFSFADVSGGEIKEWSAKANAGTLTVAVVSGFTVVSCRNVMLQPSGPQKGEFAKPIKLGFEGALKPI